MPRSCIAHIILRASARPILIADRVVTEEKTCNGEMTRDDIFLARKVRDHCFIDDQLQGKPVGYSRHVCCVEQQTCLLCDAADMSAVPHSRHVCCVTKADIHTY